MFSKMKKYKNEKKNKNRIYIKFRFLVSVFSFFFFVAIRRVLTFIDILSVYIIYEFSKMQKRRRTKEFVKVNVKKRKEIMKTKPCSCCFCHLQMFEICLLIYVCMCLRVNAIPKAQVNFQRWFKLMNVTFILDKMCIFYAILLNTFQFECGINGNEILSFCALFFFRFFFLSKWNENKKQKIKYTYVMFIKSFFPKSCSNE